MTPLGEGPRGYADWQRVVNWDGPYVLRSTTSHEGEIASGIVETSRYGYLGGFIHIKAAPVLMEITWYGDKAGTELVGQREMVLDIGISNASNLRIPNLGPFVRVGLRPVPLGTKWEGTVRIFLTNRTHPLEFIPISPLLANEELPFGGAGGSTFSPTSYYAGPVRVLLNNSANVTTTAYLEVETAPGLFFRTDLLVVEGAVSKVGTFLTPPGAWRITIETTGATTVICRLTPSLTGST